MKLCGTLVCGYSAYAVYNDRGHTIGKVYANARLTQEGSLYFGPHVRLVQVSDKSAPAVLPADLSPSLEPE